MKITKTLSNDSSSGDIAEFSSKMKTYLNTVDIQQESMTTNMADLKSASMRYTIEPAKMESAVDNKKTFLTTTITSLQSIITTLEATKLTNPEIADTIIKLQGRITSMQANLASMNTPTQANAGSMNASTGRLEGFASIMNPYDQLSPSAKQAREFGLGRKAYIDEVFSGIKLF
jgi:hypothetical protein